ncbi:MAG: GNAT family N-acetyltransferase [Gammaproteobacteria bacterium]|nr:MAG: GNAT family N-acetyltransferase [Gammaproteobacteria bacterium]
MIETQRLILRQWQTSDQQHYAAINADAEVMRYFPNTMTAAESVAQIEKLQSRIAKNAWGFWAVERKQSGEFIGMVGLNTVELNDAIPETPFVEIGWRLAKKHWRQGYAYEAASACLDYAFNTLALKNIYAFTALINTPSQRLMQKLGMHNTGRDFNHPKVESEHALSRHCLYQIERQTYLKKLEKQK